MIRYHNGSAALIESNVLPLINEASLLNLVVNRAFEIKWHGAAGIENRS